jgi:hypothetical protein
MERAHSEGAFACSQAVDSPHFVLIAFFSPLFKSLSSADHHLFFLCSFFPTCSVSPLPPPTFSPISGMCKDLQALDTLLVDGTVLMNSGVAKTVVAISTNTQLADITDTDPGE